MWPHATLADMEHDTTRLAELGRRRRKLTRELAENRIELVTEVLAALQADVRQARVVELSGYTREQIRRIWLRVHPGVGVGD